MSESSILETTYFHTMKIERDTIARDADTKVSTQTRATIATGVKCALSARTHTQPSNQTETFNDLDYRFVIFCGPDVNVAAGDIITVTFEDSSTKIVRAGEPFRWPSHKEVPCEYVNRG